MKVDHYNTIHIKQHTYSHTYSTVHIFHQMPTATPQDTDWLKPAYDPSVNVKSIHQNLASISTKTTKKHATTPSSGDTASHGCKSTVKLWYEPPEDPGGRKYRYLRKPKTPHVEIVASTKYPAVLPRITLHKTLTRQVMDAMARRKHLLAETSCYVGSEKLQPRDMLDAGKKSKKYKKIRFVFVHDPEEPLTLQKYVEKIWEELLSLTDFGDVKQGEDIMKDREHDGDGEKEQKIRKQVKFKCSKGLSCKCHDDHSP